MNNRKRRKYGMNSESGSEFSDYQLDSSLWKLPDLVSDLSFENNDLEETHAKFYKRSKISVKLCSSLIDEFEGSMETLMKESIPKTYRSIDKYLASHTYNKIQRNATQKSALVSMVQYLLTTPKFNTTEKLVDHRNFSMEMNENSDKEQDTVLQINKLSKQLDGLERKWENWLAHVRVTDPLEDIDQFFRDVQTDLDGTKNWLSHLESKLPTTSYWMATVLSMDAIQLHSARGYYQHCLEEMKRHSKSMVVVNNLLERVRSSLQDKHLQFKLQEFLQYMTQLESMCHIYWLRLLELTQCLDGIWKDSKLTTCSHETEIRHLKNNQIKNQKQLRKRIHINQRRTDSNSMCEFDCHLISNPLETINPISFVGNVSKMNKTSASSDYYASALSPAVRKAYAKTMLSPAASKKTGLESGFESEFSPQPKYNSFVDHRARDDAPLHLQFSTNDPPLSESQIFKTKSLDRIVNTDCDTNDDKGKRIESNQKCNLEQPNQTPKNFEISGPTVTDSLNLNLRELYGDWCKQTPNEPILDKLSDSFSRNILKNTHSKFSVSNNQNAEFKNKKRRSWKRFIKHGKTKAGLKSSSGDECSPNIKHIQCANCVLFGPTDRDAREWRKELPFNSASSSSSGRTSRRETDTSDGEEWNEQINAWIFKQNNKAESTLGDTSKVNSDQFSRNKCGASMEGNKKISVHKTEKPLIVVNRKEFLSSPNNKTIPCYRPLEDDENNNKTNSTSSVEKFRMTNDTFQNGTSALVRQRRVKSCLDAAVQAETMVRDHYCSTYLKKWLQLMAHGEKMDMNEVDDNEQGMLESSFQNAFEQYSVSSPPTTNEINSSRVLSDRLKQAESAEPLLNCWDDYQASLYSNSTGTETSEPVMAYPEEYPWDDIACNSDGCTQEAPCSPKKEISALSYDEYIPFVSNVTTQSANLTDIPLIDPFSGDRQDTLELSTSTSVLFNPKSSIDASFEVCAPSLATGSHASFPALGSPTIDSSDAGSAFCFRSHPDGGSQLLLDDTNDTTGNGLACRNNQRYEEKLKNREITEKFVPMITSEAVCVRPLGNTNARDRKRCRRRYGTLPRTATKKRPIEDVVTDDPTIHQWFDRNKTSSINDSTDELTYLKFHDVYRDLTCYSRRRLEELNVLFDSLQKADVTLEQFDTMQLQHTSSMSMKQWQCFLSHIVHVADANLRVLNSYVDAKYDENKPFSLQLDVLSRTNLAKTIRVNRKRVKTVRLQREWISLVEQARCILIRAYSIESLHNQLIRYRLEMDDINEAIKRLLSPEQSKMGNGRFSNRVYQWFCHKQRQYETINTMNVSIKNYLNKIDSISMQLENFQLSMEESIRILSTVLVQPTINEAPAGVVVSMKRELEAEFEQTKHQFSEIRSILNRLTTVHGTVRTNSVSNVTMEPNLQKDDSVTEMILMKENTESHLGVVQTTSHSWCMQQPYVTLLASGLVALSCFCCFLISKLFPCSLRTYNWQRNILSLLESIFGFDRGARSCPLKREQYASFVDVRQGSVPF